MIRKHNRTGSVLLAAIFGATLILSFACSKEEESLKIVIEDSTDVEAPKDGGGDINGGDGSVAKTPPGVEPGPGPGTEAPPEIGEPKTPPGTPGSESALTMKVSDVMAKGIDNEDFKKISKALPVRVMIFGLPKNRAWSVRTMFHNIELMTVVIDDNSGNILRREVKKEHNIKTLARKTKPGARRMEDYLGKLNLGYAGALNAALKDERFPKIDYTKHVGITVLLGPGKEGTTWHVVFMAGKDKKNIIASIDDYGNVLNVREEERRVRK